VRSRQVEAALWPVQHLQQLRPRGQERYVCTIWRCVMLSKKVLYVRCHVRCRKKRIIPLSGGFCLPCARASGKACVHNILKARCSICDGRALCPHLKLRGAHKSNPKPLLHNHPTPPHPSHRHVQDLQLRHRVSSRQVAKRLPTVWRLQLVPARAVEGDVPPVQRQRHLRARVLLFGV
jgi:hypothetical protein